MHSSAGTSSTRNNQTNISFNAITSFLMQLSDVALKAQTKRFHEALKDWFSSAEIEFLIKRGAEKYLADIVRYKENFISWGVTRCEMCALINDAQVAKQGSLISAIITYHQVIKLLGYNLKQVLEITNGSDVAVERIEKLRRFHRLFLEWKLDPKQVNELIRLRDNDTQLNMLANNSRILAFFGYKNDDIYLWARSSNTLKQLDNIIRNGREARAIEGLLQQFSQADVASYLAATQSSSMNYDILNAWLTKAKIQEIIAAGGEKILNELVRHAEIFKKFDSSSTSVEAVLRRALESKSEAFIADFAQKLFLLTRLGFTSKNKTEVGALNTSRELLIKLGRFYQLFRDWKFEPSEIIQIIQQNGNEPQLSRLQENSQLLARVGCTKSEIKAVATSRAVSSEPKQSLKSILPTPDPKVRELALLRSFRHITPLIFEVKRLKKSGSTALKRKFTSEGSVYSASFFAQEGNEFKTRRIIVENDNKVIVRRG